MAQIDRSQGLVGNLGVKAPVRAASTANLTLSGEQTVDGVVLVTGDRVLVWQQTTASENGIYVVDTGSWTRADDFDGSYDITQGTLVRVYGGSSYAGAWFEVTSADGVTIGTDSITFGRTGVTAVQLDHQVASAGQTLINLGITYQLASNNIAVYVNGLRLRITDDYNETSTSSITLTYGLQAGDEVDVYVGEQIGNLLAAAASLVAISDAGDYYVATSVEAALQEIRDSIAADNGDAAKTLTYASSDPVQRWNTALTAARAVTLSTSQAKEGAHFIIVRGAGATGNFNLTVGSLCTLTGPGQWCEVRYDAGTAAWILEKFGYLPAADLQGYTSVGDASATLTVGTSNNDQRWAASLTAERTATLATTGIWPGAKFHLQREEVAGGGFSLTVQVGSTVLIRLAPGQWCDVESDGTTWYVARQGWLRPRPTSIVVLEDDFLGEEVDAFKWQSLIGTDPSCSQAIVLADQYGGVAQLTTGADAGATMALNGAQMHSQLNWRANGGGLVWEGRVNLDAITNVCLFIGMTDQRAALEMPFTLAAGDVLTANATDACGILFDTGADTDDWWLVGVAAGVAAAKQDTALAPVAGTFELWRVEVNSAGQATFYRNNVLIGTAMAGAVTSSVLLTPVIAAFSRGAASRNVRIDLHNVAQQR
ncbi:MAG TPA: hypothetical protein VF151_10895 [Gemmatimonadales bacterium]